MGDAFVTLGVDIVVSTDRSHRTYHVAVAKIFATKGRPHQECSNQLCSPRPLAIADAIG